jgi:predicted transcriptional regulator
MATTDPGLTQADLRRLEKLAKSAGRTPRAMLKFVLRDGFAETERVVGAVQAGREDVAAGRVRAHAAAMAEADAMIARRASSKRAA